MVLVHHIIQTACAHISEALAYVSDYSFIEILNDCGWNGESQTFIVEKLESAQKTAMIVPLF